MKYMEVLFVIYIKYIYPAVTIERNLKEVFLILLIFALCISTEKERMKRRTEKKRER